jgi:hypothetical protein
LGVLSIFYVFVGDLSLFCQFWEVFGELFVFFGFFVGCNIMLGDVVSDD